MNSGTSHSLKNELFFVEQSLEFQYDMLIILPSKVQTKFVRKPSSEGRVFATSHQLFLCNIFEVFYTNSLTHLFINMH